jgi:hypothetical protein
MWGLNFGISNMGIVNFLFLDFLKFENYEGFQMSDKSISRGQGELILLNARCRERIKMLCIFPYGMHFPGHLVADAFY